MRLVRRDDAWAEWRRLEERRARWWLLKVALGGVLALAALGWGLQALSQEIPAPGTCHYGDGGTPDPACTPGSTDIDDVQILCQHKSQERRKTPDKAKKRKLAAAYGVKVWQVKENDHSVPICLGGSERFDNIWPQIIGVKEKDRIEAAACRAICDPVHPISLEAARAVVANWAWHGPNGEWQTWAK